MSRKFPGIACLVLGILLLGEIGFVNSQPTPRKQPVSLRVLLPAANAKLTVDETQTKQVGTTRLFVSPPLEPGAKFEYTLTAVWQPNNYTTITRTREVLVMAGQTIEVDMRLADDKRPDKILIRYVPTPNEVVEAMLKLGEVGKGDVVYDLGCGDGRLVVDAVKKFHAKKGVGIDIDPERITDSKANAKKFEVEDKVEFRQGDVLEIQDLSDANVVMLYMGNELNLRLRPILQAKLKPGSRIVSHRFLMGDWKPLQTETITDSKGVKYQIHLWKIGDDEGKK